MMMDGEGWLSKRGRFQRKQIAKKRRVKKSVIGGREDGWLGRVTGGHNTRGQVGGR